MHQKSMENVLYFNEKLNQAGSVKNGRFLNCMKNQGQKLKYHFSKFEHFFFDVLHIIRSGISRRARIRISCFFKASFHSKIEKTGRMFKKGQSFAYFSIK
jgi:hypothetical protein